MPETLTFQPDNLITVSITIVSFDSTTLTKTITATLSAKDEILHRTSVDTDITLGIGAFLAAFLHEVADHLDAVQAANRRGVEHKDPAFPHTLHGKLIGELAYAPSDLHGWANSIATNAWSTHA